MTEHEDTNPFLELSLIQCRNYGGTGDLYFTVEIPGTKGLTLKARFCETVVQKSEADPQPVTNCNKLGFLKPMKWAAFKDAARIVWLYEHDVEFEIKDLESYIGELLDRRLRSFPTIEAIPPADPTIYPR